MVAGVLSERFEGALHVDVLALGDDALRLLDDDAPVEGRVELVDELVRPADRPVLQDRDGRDVGERTGGTEPLVVDTTRVVLKRLRAPITSPRRRSGMAWTARKPLAIASGANRGQRSTADSRSTCATASPDR